MGSNPAASGDSDVPAKGGMSDTPPAARGARVPDRLPTGHGDPDLNNPKLPGQPGRTDIDRPWTDDDQPSSI